MKKLVVVFVLCFLALGMSFSEETMFFNVGMWADVQEFNASGEGFLYPKLEIVAPAYGDVIISRIGVSFYEDFIFNAELQFKKEVIKNFLFFAAGGGGEFNTNKLQMSPNLLFSALVKLSPKAFIDISCLWKFDKTIFLGAGLWF